MQLYACYKTLFQRLEPKALVLTPNLRLSRFVKQQWDAYQLGLGHNAWPDLACHAWRPWCCAQYLEAGLPGQLLEEAHCALLWQRAVEDVAPDAENREALADYASTAFERARLWRLEESDLNNGSLESELLIKLTEAYSQKLRQHGWLDFPACLQALVEAWQANTSSLPVSAAHPSLLLLGFDDIAPLLQALFDALRAGGTRVGSENLALAGVTRSGPAEDADEEIQVAFTWARAKLAAAQEHGHTPRIGIVIPELARLRPSVERALAQAFEPDYALPDRPQHAPGYNISAGQPLAHTPLVHCALVLMSLPLTALPSTEVAQLALSPFLWGELALRHRSALATAVREEFLTFDLRQWCALLAGLQPDGLLGEMLGKLRGFGEAFQSARGQKRSYRQWAQWFHCQLEQLGWPGARTLDTLEFQQYQSWCEVLQAFAGFDRIENGCDLASAVSHLKKACYVPFLPQTNDSPLQVLGILEAAGLHFDALWITGLSDEVWPAPCEPNPLLPTALQKLKGLPRASVHREYELAERITRRFAGAAFEVIFSWPAWRGDEPLRPSTLLQPLVGDAGKLPGIDEAQLPMIPVEMAPLEWLEDAHGSTYPDSGQAVRGGSGLLKDQAACPFRAFARYRLGAQNPDWREPGVGPLLRGNLIHEALDRFWRATGNHAALSALAESELTARVDRAVRQSWVRLTRGEFGARTEALETERAARLMTAWLALEKQRAPFSVVLAEQQVTGAVGPLTVRTRMDRIDTTEDGRAVVIDYKTGQTDIKTWFGERPDEPQVPLYTVLQKPVHAAVFAELSFKAVAARGVVADEALWPGLATVESLTRLSDVTDWPALVAQWQRVLETLATEFSQGLATVTPKHKNTCDFCDLHSFCRIGHRRDDPEGSDAAQ